MQDCSYCWSRYMRATALASQQPDRGMRKALIHEAFIWLDRYFEAEDRELAWRIPADARR